MKKQLCDVTVGEWKSVCDKRAKEVRTGSKCSGCPIVSVCSSSPVEWDLRHTVMLTVLTWQELHMLRGIPGAEWVSHDNEHSHTVEIWDKQPVISDGIYYAANGGQVLAMMQDSIFPSIDPGDCIEIKEVVGQ